MREILFKGKRVDNGEWIEGGTYLYDPDLVNVCIGGYDYYKTEDGWQRDEYCCEVDSETVCEYTGLTDKNGRKIFEGDIVRFRHGGEFHDKGIWYRNYAIEYVNTFCTYGLRFRNKSIHFPCKQATISMHDVEVIGNIFDNAELLKGADGNE